MSGQELLIEFAEVVPFSFVVSVEVAHFLIYNFTIKSAGFWGFGVLGLFWLY